jgi:hypothetical protein
VTSTSAEPRARRAALAVAVLALAVALAAPSVAYAGDGDSSPLNDVSSVDQYTEDIPTASGPKPTGGAPGENAHVPNQLPADVANALDVQGGADAEALGRLATLPSVGAPRKGLRAGPAVQRALAENQSIGAAVGSAASGATPALYALVVLLVGITAGLLAAAVRRARR